MIYKVFLACAEPRRFEYVDGVHADNPDEAAHEACMANDHLRIEFAIARPSSDKELN